jgi:hypothetical protein
MTNEEMLKADLERAVKELGLDGSNTKQKVKYLLEECLEVYFKPKKYLTYAKVLKLKPKSYKVLFNGSEYRMVITQHEYGKVLYLVRIGDISDITPIFNVLLWEHNKPYINDLHLELVEE